MPFTYLGLPLGTKKPRIQDFSPLMDRIERSLLVMSSLLSYLGRLQRVNSVISTIPTYAMCTLKLPVVVTNYVDRIMKQCLWRRADINKKGGNLASWDKVCKPINKGGLGVINLTLQNDALLLKHLDKFYNKKDLPWVSLIWNKYYKNKVPHATREVGSFWGKDVLRLNVLYKGIAKSNLGRGETVQVWDDLWADSVLSTKYNSLYAYVKNPRISVQNMLATTDIISMFNLPLSQQVFAEFMQFQEDRLAMANEDVNDQW